VLDPHSNVTSGGRVIVGGVVSRNVMVWTQLRLLPHWSVAVHRREMTLAPPQMLLTESLYAIVTELQPSWPVATPVTFVVVLAGHSRTTSGGQLIVGAVVS
jgi:hypothetical protein